MWGYICVPNSNDIDSKTLEHIWKESNHIQNIYSATATFSLEGKSYFPNYSNYYLLASFSDFEHVKKELNDYAGEKMSFVFSKKKLLFQTPMLSKLNYLSIYFIKQSYDQDILEEMEYVFLRRRERLRTASLTEMGVIFEPSLKFRFPYLKDIVLLELESEKSHRSDRKYCERTLKEILRKGISVNNLVSFSVLSELKD